MKTILALGLVMMMGMATGCNSNDQDIQREEEMNREDVSEDSYDQDDVSSGSVPSNIDGPVSEE